MATTTSSLDRFIATHQKSKELWERSLKVSRGIHHDSRFSLPFAIYTARAQGSRKWDVDGNEYIDYTMGHGSLILGHAHPILVEAVSQQVAKGTHYGTENELAIEWAELICQLIPAAQRVEFVLTGTEANIMIAQLARAYTGRNKILKFARQFFGWSDHLYVGYAAPYDKPLAGHLSPMTEDAVSGATVVIPCNDEAAMEKALAKRDIAAFFLEGGGASGGTIGMPPELVKKARELTQEYGTLLVIDEVISGFRWSPGGYQATVGVTPDLTPLGKIVSGGLGGGAAVCGRAEVMELLKIKPGDAEWNRYRRVYHNGTWNANPLNAAAGVAMLKVAAKGEVQKTAEAAARKLADGMNRKIEERGIEGCVFNSSSVLHVHLGKCQRCDRSLCLDATKIMSPDVVNALNWYLLLHGVNLLRGTTGWVSAVHTEEDISQTIEAFGAVLDDMVADGVI
ncbi:MAG TPA: aminotransferase class III-fold pyridoxal phosphate-dependent enzyme [Dehalococcoidia bacterium]|jgi:glutamate-1-semialdehyde 2,1-aminomutase|nr:aminotransferase class III-fold pyridoxal phosphate-dependent enzyme [Dehalococcoidia bacterium]